MIIVNNSVDHGKKARLLRNLCIKTIIIPRQAQDNDHFTKTGSGQTQGKLKKDAFLQSTSTA